MFCKAALMVSAERSLGEFDFYRIAAEFAFEGFGGSFGHDMAAIDDGNVLREAIGLFEIVRGEQESTSLPRRGGRSPPTVRRAPRGRGRWWARRETKRADDG